MAQDAGSRSLEILQKECPDDFQHFPADARLTGSRISDIFVINVLQNEQAIDLGHSEYKLIPGTDRIQKFHKWNLGHRTDQTTNTILPQRKAEMTAHNTLFAAGALGGLVALFYIVFITPYKEFSPENEMIVDSISTFYEIESTEPRRAIQEFERRPF